MNSSLWIAALSGIFSITAAIISSLLNRSHERNMAERPRLVAAKVRILDALRDVELFLGSGSPRLSHSDADTRLLQSLSTRLSDALSAHRGDLLLNRRGQRLVDDLNELLQRLAFTGDLQSRLAIAASADQEPAADASLLELRAQSLAAADGSHQLALRLQKAIRGFA